ncbi:MAG: SDR family oxidoreductase [Thermodesulfobacteriota bacterium]|nr:SDR family oxidoreductase [Thermodesulfobacteriota bacterium]
MTTLPGKLAFITGGSSGIGLATATQLARKGCRLVLFARKQEGLDAACESIRQQSASSDSKPSVAAITLDVADNDAVQSVISHAVATYGTPDILINCAGVGTADYFENISYESFDHVMKINVYGTRNMVSAVLPFMKQAGYGHIVNVASVAGLIGMFGYTLYSCTKYALVGFSECLRAELKRHHIQVTLFCPPEVDTPFVTEEARTLPPPSRAIKRLAGLLTPEQAAKSVVTGIRRNRFLVAPGAAAKWLVFWHRISNGRLTRTPSDWIVALTDRR